MGNGELITAGVVGGGFVMVFGGMVAYFTAENMGEPGWTGPASMVAVLGSTGGLAVAAKVSKNRRERREIERAHARWLEFRATFPHEVHYALDVLADDLQACMMWTHPQIGVGLPVNPNVMFPGTWPRLLPGQDPGHAADPGMRISPVGARIRLEMPQGYSADHIRHRLSNLASSLQVPKVQVVAARGNIVSIELRVRNPLEDSMKLVAPEASPVPLEAVRVGGREDGVPWRLMIRGNHLFIAGLTGSGKSGLLWSIVAGLAPDIAAGRVELHMVDLKLGTEMSAGYRLYASWAYEVAEGLAVLEKMVHIMRNRANPRREHSMRTGEPLRKHEPIPGDPHHVLMIDEIIALLKLPGDRKIRANIRQLDGTFAEEEVRVGKYAGLLLLELLSQARSFGISVIVATQNAAKEIFDLLRDMFPTMVGLRLASEEQQRMVFGTGAAERGVEATEITVDEAGTVYVDSPEAGGMAIRARAFKVTDTDIIHLVRIFGRPADAPALPTLAVLTPATPKAAESGSSSNVVELHPEEVPLADSAPGPGKCRFCGREIQQTPGGRPALYCPGTDHRQQYHRLKARLEKKAQGGN